MPHTPSASPTPAGYEEITADFIEDREDAEACAEELFNPHRLYSVLTRCSRLKAAGGEGIVYECLLELDMQNLSLLSDACTARFLDPNKLRTKPLDWKEFVCALITKSPKLIHLRQFQEIALLATLQ